MGQIIINDEVVIGGFEIRAGNLDPDKGLPREYEVHLDLGSPSTGNLGHHVVRVTTFDKAKEIERWLWTARPAGVHRLVLDTVDNEETEHDFMVEWFDPDDGISHEAPASFNADTKKLTVDLSRAGIEGSEKICVDVAVSEVT